jgi:hypothetical protein
MINQSTYYNTSIAYILIFNYFLPNIDYNVLFTVYIFFKLSSSLVHPFLILV